MTIRRMGNGISVAARRLLAMTALLAVPVIGMAATQPSYAGTPAVRVGAWVSHGTGSQATPRPRTAAPTGYDMVGSDGGVFAFGDAGFEGSLPGQGVHVNNIVGIAGTPDNRGYWLLANDGTVYNFGSAAALGSLTCPTPGTCGNLVSIVSTSTGNGFWITDQFGTVYPFGDATNVGDLSTSPTGPSNIVSLVPTKDNLGYFLVGSDGGLFAFGDTTFFGSLPGLGVTVNNIVGAVATTAVG